MKFNLPVLFLSLILCLCLSVILHLPLAAQDYTFKVLGVRGNVRVPGKTEIKVNLKLDQGDTILIMKDGYIALIHHTGEAMELKEEGVYPIQELDQRVANLPPPPPFAPTLVGL